MNCRVSKIHVQKRRIPSACNSNSIGMQFRLHKHKMVFASATMYFNLKKTTISPGRLVSAEEGVWFFLAVCRLLPSFLDFLSCRAPHSSGMHLAAGPVVGSFLPPPVFRSSGFPLTRAPPLPALRGRRNTYSPFKCFRLRPNYCIFGALIWKKQYDFG